MGENGAEVKGGGGAFDGRKAEREKTGLQWRHVPAQVETVRIDRFRKCYKGQRLTWGRARSACPGAGQALPGAFGAPGGRWRGRGVAGAGGAGGKALHAMIVGRRAKTAIYPEGLREDVYDYQRDAFGQ